MTIGTWLMVVSIFTIGLVSLIVFLVAGGLFLIKRVCDLPYNKRFTFITIGFSLTLSVISFGYDYWYTKFGAGPWCSDVIVEQNIGKYHLIFPAKLAGYRKVPDLRHESSQYFEIVYPEMVARCDKYPSKKWHDLWKENMRIIVSSAHFPPSLEKLLANHLYNRSWFKPSYVQDYRKNLKRVKNSKTSPPTDIFLGQKGNKIVWLAECATWAPNPICVARITDYPNLTVSYNFHFSHIEEWEEVDRITKLFLKNIMTEKTYD